MQIILASGSPRRKELLGELLKKYGLDFKIESSNVSEEELKQTIKEPKKLVQELSYSKANDIYEKHKEDKEDFVVIGADTIVYFESQFLGKPKDGKEAETMLEQIQGKANDVYTGMTMIIQKDQKASVHKSCSVSKVYMEEMTRDHIVEYVATKEPLDKAGSYAIQGIGSKYVKKYKGEFNTIVGLDTNKLEKTLRENGILETSYDIRAELLKVIDKKHAAFNQKLCPDTQKPMLGIRIPILRNLAKKLLKENSLEELLEQLQNEYFEEILLEGFLIGYANIAIEKKLAYIKRFVPKIDSWAISDTFVPTLKIKKQNLATVWEFILPYLQSDQEFEVRFAIIMLLDYYIEQDHVNSVIELLDQIKHEGYYVKMAVAWTLSVIGVKFYEKFMAYFQNNHLDEFTNNKTIQKMCESYRIEEEKKKVLRSMRKKSKTMNEKLIEKALENVKKKLEEKEATLVVYKEQEYTEYFDPRIQRMITILKEDEKGLSDAILADRVIGKAAASIMAKAKVKAIYAKLISKKALEVLQKENIMVKYERLVDYIQNSSKDGMCPMEEKCWNIDSADEIYKMFVK